MKMLIKNNYKIILAFIAVIVLAFFRCMAFESKADFADAFIYKESIISVLCIIYLIRRHLGRVHNINVLVLFLAIVECYLISANIFFSIKAYEFYAYSFQYMVLSILISVFGAIILAVDRIETSSDHILEEDVLKVFISFFYSILTVFYCVRIGACEIDIVGAVNGSVDKNELVYRHTGILWSTIVCFSFWLFVFCLSFSLRHLLIKHEMGNNKTYKIKHIVAFVFTIILGLGISFQYLHMNGVLSDYKYTLDSCDYDTNKDVLEVNISEYVGNSRSVTYTGKFGIWDIENPWEIYHLIKENPKLNEYVVQKLDENGSTYFSFSDCENIEKIVVSEGITEVRMDIYNCPNLKTIELPKSVEKVYFTIRECNKLEKIPVSKTVAFYPDENGADRAEVEKGVDTYFDLQ